MAARPEKSATQAVDAVSPAVMDADSIAYMASQTPRGALMPADAARENQRRTRPLEQPDLPQVAQVRELAAAGPAGAIPLRYYRPVGCTAADILPAQIYYHGGGWVLGDLDSHDWVCRMVANAAQCAVVSVDYRLAPEHPFPAAFDDSLAAAEWIAANASALKIDPKRLSVGGDSSGGNLAAAVALGLRDRGTIKLRAQMLTYPVTDLTARYDGRFASGVFLTNERMRDYIAVYVPDEAQRNDWRCSPFYAQSLKGLPPALFVFAGFDPLHAEGVAYAERLRRDGVSVTVKTYPGQMHGFVSRSKLLPRAYDAIADIAAALKAAY
jgi:acetyl esterase/lipase